MAPINRIKVKVNLLHHRPNCRCWACKKQREYSNGLRKPGLNGASRATLERRAKNQAENK